jgi:3-oxoacyl-[acyl-carrier-protein] synthase II
MERTASRCPRRNRRSATRKGASGAAGLAAALVRHTHRTLPPTINLDEPDPACDLDYIPNVAREGHVRVALCNCIGFGSKNSALIVERISS